MIGGAYITNKAVFPWAPRNVFCCSSQPSVCAQERDNEWGYNGLKHSLVSFKTLRDVYYFFYTQARLVE